MLQLPAKNENILSHGIALCFNSNLIERAPLKRNINFIQQFVTLGEASTQNLSFFSSNECCFYFKIINCLIEFAVSFNIFLQNFILFTFSLLPSIGSN